LNDVTDAQWTALANTKIFFGHQSVGGNILDGVADVLAEHPRIPLRVVEAERPVDVAGAALVHARLGTNGDPAGKAGEFASRMTGGLGEAGGIAMFKLCYVDFDHRTDVDAVFQAYQANVEQVRASQPDTRIVHITTPVTIRREPFKDFLRKVLGKPTYADVDRLRARYNELLRSAYDGKDPIFDLARIEATRPDGSLEAVRQGGDTVLNLVPAYTDDGSHLNQDGRRRVAEQLLVFLAGVAAPR